MKKIFSFTAVAVMLSAFAFGQSQRLVLLEHFTGASCPPCATFNPGVNNILTANPDKIVAIKYQLAPPGFDPMYEHNPQQSGARFSYYNGSGIPNSAIDGNHYNGHPSNWNTATVNNRYAVPSPFDIDIEYTVTPYQIMATVVVTASMDFEATGLRLHTVVVEKEINFDTSPGSNGETVFKNVMKRMLPSNNGTVLTGTWEAGQSDTISLSWDHANVYNYDQLAIVAFVQSNGSKEIHQTAYNDSITYSSDFSYAGIAKDVFNLPGNVCTDGTIALNHQVNLINFGTETMTSCDIVTTVNGEDFSTAWSGELNLLEQLLVSVDPIAVTSVPDLNNIGVRLENINGSDNEVDDSYTATVISDDEISYTEVDLEITFDCWPQETRWRFENAETNAIVAQGGPYPGGQAQQTFSTTVNLPTDGCYRFIILDSYGDGLNGIPSGCPINGSVSVTDAFENVIFTNNGSNQWSERQNAFTAMMSLNDETVQSDFGLQVYPNPTSDIANFTFDLPNATRVRYDVVNLVGQTVKMKDLGMLPSGNMMATANFSELSPGIYLINFRFDDQVIAKKIVVRH